MSQRQLPTFMERTGPDVVGLDPYSRLFKDRIVFIRTRLDDTVAADVTAQLLHLDHANPDRELSVYLHSSGGSLTAALTIYDTMRQLAADIETVCLGETGPEAALLLAAGTSGRRKILPHARVVLREPTTEPGSIEPGRGSTSDLLIHAAEIQRQKASMVELLAHHTGQAQADVRQDISRDHLLDATAAKAYGLVDLILDPRRSRP